MLAHELARELLAGPNYEVSYADGDELLDIDCVDEEGGEIVLSCEEEDESAIIDLGPEPVTARSF